jgi:hypothetical protein
VENFNGTLTETTPPTMDGATDEKDERDKCPSENPEGVSEQNPGFFEKPGFLN